MCSNEGINVFILERVLIFALSKLNYGFQVENELKFPPFFFVLLLSLKIYLRQVNSLAQFGVDAVE